jgi:hypothetical protein
LRKAVPALLHLDVDVFIIDKREKGILGDDFEGNDFYGDA